MEPKVRIDLLEVHFDVVGDGEQEFVKLFEKYINRWSQVQRDRERCAREFEDERTIGDRRSGGR